MLTIRLQRTGRSGHAQFRLIVQDSRFTPTSGRVVAFLGSYNPHTKEAVVDKEKAAQYLANGAQPSDRAAKLLKKEGVKLPDWVELAPPQKKATRHPEKLRRNRPADAPEPEPKADAVAEETAEPTADSGEAPAEVSEAPEPEAKPEVASADEAKTEEPAGEKVSVEPTEDSKPEVPEAAPEEPETPADLSTKAPPEEKIAA